ncbi:unnamed protein product, partial [Nesidiocoris tenuis]
SKRGIQPGGGRNGVHDGRPTDDAQDERSGFPFRVPLSSPVLRPPPVVRQCIVKSKYQLNKSGKSFHIFHNPLPPTRRGRNCSCRFITVRATQRKVIRKPELRERIHLSRLFSGRTFQNVKFCRNCANSWARILQKSFAQEPSDVNLEHFIGQFKKDYVPIKPACYGDDLSKKSSANCKRNFRGTGSKVLCQLPYNRNNFS